VVVLFVQVAVAVGTLGPTFIKFGQALASRPDLVGAAFADALTVLQVYSDDAKEIAGFREQQRERNSYSLRG
jgi:predicted unusual protein kinase regulating ubiquinone biosynthesis (AarF/ABC1/UbiB family)